MSQPSSHLASWLRAGLGARVTTLGMRPLGPLVLYDFEACPFCRKVREAVSTLDLVVDIRPCPKGGTRFRGDLAQRGLPVEFPTLIDRADPDGELVLQESDAIVTHLYQRYGAGPPPLRGRVPVLSPLSSALSSAVRGVRGLRARPSRRLERAYELYSFEASAGARPVREVMTELEIPYRLRSCAAGSRSREDVQHVPTLREKDLGLERRGAGPIIAYLEQEHAA